MPCLNITSGPFIGSEPAVLWNEATSDTALNGTIITRTTSGSNPGILFERGTINEFFPLFPGAQQKFMRFGSPANFILALDVRSSGDRFVTLIDTSGTSGISTQSILFVNEPNSVGLPAVHRSPGNGSVFLIFSPSSGGSVKNVLLCRSDTGVALCSAVPFPPSGQVNAEATATQLLIKDGGSTVASCALPQEDCDVVPNTRTFTDAVLGAGVAPSLASSIEQFTIENDGDDCLTVNSIGNVVPFSVSGTSSPFPIILDPGDDFTVDVLFAPSGLGNYDENLPINPTPDNGDTFLRCRGEARSAVISVTFAGVIGFGVAPVGGSSMRPLTITNDGEASVNYTVPASAAGLLFQWSASSGSLAPGDSTDVDITFSPVAEGNFDRTLTFTSSDPSSPHNVMLQGEGCVPNATLFASGPTAFGEVQRGFRTVRVVRVNNTGDAILYFRALIQGADAALFGLQMEGGSITSPESEIPFSLNPTVACGAVTTGSGEIVFAVTFYANDVPGVYNAELVIDSHNATNPISASLTFPLSAEVIPLVNIDVELVLDRSSSMSGTSGERTKMQTAIDAGKLFIELARPDVGDRIGVTRFNDFPEVVPGLSITEVTSANQGLIAGAINNSNLSPAGFTTIAGGVMVAVKDIDDNPRVSPPSELNTAVVVLTDGIDTETYLNPDDGVSYSLLGGDGTTAMPAPTGKQLYAVGIGDSIDVGRLSVLADSTGGEFLHVTEFSGLDFFALEKYFTQIYMEAVDLAIVEDPAFYIKPGEEHCHFFDVLKGDTRFMVVIYDKDNIRVPFYLKAPNGEIVDLTSVPPGYQVRPGITSTARFLEVALPEGEPDRYGGAWKAVLYHDGKACFDRDRQPIPSTAPVNPNPTDFGNYGFGFRPQDCRDYDERILYGFAIGAGSNFRMQPYVEPGIVKIGDHIRLNAVVTEFSLPVIGCTVSVEAKDPNGGISHFTMLDDGSHEDDDAEDGNYGRVYTATNVEGFYTFTFRSHGFSRDGEPVKREAVRSKYVEGRVPLIPKDPGDDGRGDKCCEQLSRWLRILVGLVGILVVLLILDLLN